MQRSRANLPALAYSPQPLHTACLFPVFLGDTGEFLAPKEALKQLPDAAAEMRSEKQEQQQTWISLCSSSLARRFREMLTFSGNPPFRFNKGILDVSRVSAFGWEYLRALKSLCMAWPTTTFPERIFRIWGGKERTFEQAPVYHAAQWRVLPHKQSDAQNQEHGSISENHSLGLRCTTEWEQQKHGKTSHLLQDGDWDVDQDTTSSAVPYPPQAALRDHHKQL